MIFQKNLEVLGTELIIKINSDSLGVDIDIQKAFSEAKRIENKYSRFLSGNELHSLNNNTGSWVKVSDELFYLLKIGSDLEIKTKKKFCLSVKSILDSWGYNEKYELHKEHASGKIGNLLIDEKNKKVLISSPIDLGAIGKGYALDKIQNLLEKYENILINAGGDIYARGKNEKGEIWKIYMEHPLKEGKVIGEIEINNNYIASSNPFKRRWRNRHHLVNAIKMEPANEMISSWIIDDTGIYADGLSTSLFVMGYEKAKTFIRKNNINAMLIGPNGDIFTSNKFSGKLYAK